jgi:transcriptional regulator with XRE-family HTH domain
VDKTVQELIGASVRDLRQAAGLTQAELGKAMTEGFEFKWENAQAVAAAESGKRRFQVDEVLALAAYFDVSPTALLIAPGSQIDGSITITTNDRRITIMDYARWWLADKQSAPVEVVDKVASRRSLDRPWSRLRRKGKHLTEAFEASRQARLAKRPPAAYPGPVVLPTRPAMEISTSVAPFGQSVRITIPATGYTGRDDIERDILLAAAERGDVEVVDRRSRRLIGSELQISVSGPTGKES